MKRKIKPDMSKKYVKGKPLRIPVGVQQHYVAQVVRMVNAMTRDAETKVVELFNKHADHFVTDSVGMDATEPSFASQTRILVNKLKSKWDQLFGKFAMGISPWMADSINRASSVSVDQSVMDMPNLHDESRKLSIDIKTLSKKGKEILKSSANHSADFIKSLPETYLNKVANATYQSIVTGNGLQDLNPFFRQEAGKTARWAELTAMDQTRKTYNGLNKARMQKIGITKGEWIHSGGSQHPRELHEDFDGQTFDLATGAPIGDDDGNNVDPGEEPNCRCTFAPVVEFAEDDD